MNKTSILKRTHQALFITGISIFAFAPAHAADACLFSKLIRDV